MTLEEARIKFSAFIALLPQKAKELGYDLAFDELMNHQGIGHRPGSLHYSGCAGDGCLYKDGVYLKGGDPYAQLGTYWESLDSDCRWGGRFTDPDNDHFSYAPKALFNGRE